MRTIDNKTIGHKNNRSQMVTSHSSAVSLTPSMLRDAQQLEMEFGWRSKFSHTTTKRLCEIVDISLYYSDYKDKRQMSELRLRTDD